MTPRVSVAVSTYQRAGRLPSLLAALEAQTLPVGEFEVVIADNGSTDDSAEVLAKLAASTPLQLRVVRAEVNRGPSAGRNLAWRATTAPVVAFTDDDCEPTPSWLASGLAAIEGGAGIAVGRTMPLPSQRHLLDRPFARTVDIAKVRFFETCNVFYRRADLESADGFDEAFTTPAGEDTDLGLRIKETGAAEPAFVPEAVVYHDVRAGGWVDAVQETLRWVDIPRVISRHPDARLELLHSRWFWKRSHPWVLLATLGLLLSPRTPFALVLVAPWVYHRTRVVPLCPGPRRRVVMLPLGFALDLVEVGVMVRGSYRHRTLVL